MITINADTCDDAWRSAAALVKEQGTTQASRTFRSANPTETLELLHASLTIADPRQRVVFARPINPAFALAEVIWILAGSNDLNFIKFWNPIMAKFSADGATLSGAYGYRLGGNSMGEFDSILPHTGNGYFMPAQFYTNQLVNAYYALKNVPHSRQVVLQIWDVKQDFPVDDGKPRNPDIPCNLMSHLLVREGKLHWLQIMRSNDLMWGTPYNFIQWTSLQEVVAGWLGLEVGQYTHVASSLHVYQEQWPELLSLELTNWSPGEAIAPGINKVHLWNPPTNTADARIVGYEVWKQNFKILLDAAVKLTQAKDTQEIFDINYDAHGSWGLDEWFTYFDTQPTSGPAAYCQWLAVLSAEACRKLGEDEDALHIIQFAGPYWKESWLQWYSRKLEEANAKMSKMQEKTGAAVGR